MVFDNARYAFRVGLVCIERDRLGARGEKIDLIAHPHGVKVAGIFVRHFDGGGISEIGDPHLRRQPAVIMGPESMYEIIAKEKNLAWQRRISEMRAIRGIRSL